MPLLHPLINDLSPVLPFTERRVVERSYNRVGNLLAILTPVHYENCLSCRYVKKPITKTVKLRTQYRNNTNFNAGKGI
jgi:hypothetical protein